MGAQNARTDAAVEIVASAGTPVIRDILEQLALSVSSSSQDLFLGSAVASALRTDPVAGGAGDADFVSSVNAIPIGGAIDGALGVQNCGERTRATCNDLILAQYN